MPSANCCCGIQTRCILIYQPQYGNGVSIFKTRQNLHRRSLTILSLSMNKNLMFSGGTGARFGSGNRCLRYTGVTWKGRVTITKEKCISQVAGSFVRDTKKPLGQAPNPAQGMLPVEESLASLSFMAFSSWCLCWAWSSERVSCASVHFCWCCIWSLKSLRMLVNLKSSLFIYLFLAMRLKV